MTTPSETPVTFTRDEAKRIRALLKTLPNRVYCPRCGDTLTLSEPGPSERDGHVAYEVICEPCRRAALIVVPSEIAGGS